MAVCPECESDIDLDGYDLNTGDTTNCPQCSCELKVASVDPVHVVLTGDEEEE